MKNVLITYAFDLFALAIGVSLGFSLLPTP